MINKIDRITLHLSLPEEIENNYLDEKKISTSKKGIKSGETRATFIVNEDQLEKIRALAYWNRVSIKEIIEEIISDYLEKKKRYLPQVLLAYKG